MRCPHCAVDINDPSPECPGCGFHIRDLDAELGDPPERANVVDVAGVLSERGVAQLQERIAQFGDRAHAELVVVTRTSCAPRLPSEYVFWLFNHWQVGGDERRGIAVLLAVDERRIESEVGLGLERIVSDEASTMILREHAVPMLSAGQFDEGLYHAVNMLCTVVENAGQGANR